MPADLLQKQSELKRSRRSERLWCSMVLWEKGDNLGGTARTLDEVDGNASGGIMSEAAALS